jgi:molybdopterin-guanine dinucleotide biosynthesis protein A
VDFAAVVLAGGRAERLGGADKAALDVDGTSLIERALAAVAAAGHVVVVGDERPTSLAVTWVREQPAYGGPVAATYAGLDALKRGSPVQMTGDDGRMTGQTHGTTPVVVLAVDMPDVTAGTVRRLLDGVAGRDGAVLVDGGRRHLAFAVSRAAVDRVRPASTTGAAMRDLWSALDLAEVPAVGEEAHDVDRWSDLGPTRDPRG